MWMAYLRSAAEGFGGFGCRGREIVVVGVPMDFTSSYRSGSRFAPAMIREISQSMELCSVFGDCCVEEQGLDDIGDILPIPGEVKKSLEIISSMAEDLIRQGRRFIALGGDHTITVALFDGAKRGLGRAPCILVVDAHLDLRDELVGKYSHATCMRRLVERAEPPKIVWFGARAFSKEELEYLKQLRVPYLMIKSVEILNDPRSAISRAIDFLSDCSELYISIDVDGFDPSYAPGVQTPEPVGIHPLHLLELLHRMEIPIASADIVEISPPYDSGGSTSALGARLVIELATRMHRLRLR